MPIKLETHSLSVCYGSKKVLSDVSIVLEQNQITAIVGPSGCGKSTFLWTLNRMHDLNYNARVSGRVLLDGRDVLRPEEDVLQLRRRVGLIFQRPNVFPFSIWENVAFALREHGVQRKDISLRVEESLQAAALWDEVKDRLEKPAVTLSGGQQQRLCIARALALQPEVILMDEPCASLDPTSTAKIEELLRRLSGHYTVAIVTHNLAQARRTSKQLACFWVTESGMGVLQEQGSTEELFAAAKTAEVRDYIQGRAG